jgi:hypothetical protein
MRARGTKHPAPDTFPNYPRRAGNSIGLGTDERIEPLGVYLVRRFFLMLLTLFGISVIIFVLLRVMPGNIVDILYDAAGYVNPREKAKIEAELGLDKPIVV